MPKGVYQRKKWYPEKHYMVIEVKAPRISQEWSRELKDSVGTLASHPGFIALTNRLSLQREMLKSKLASEYHKDLREVDYLQAGCFWLGYLQEQVAKATKLPPPVPVDPYDEELEAFRKLDAAIERVGMGPQDSEN